MTSPSHINSDKSQSFRKHECLFRVEEPLIEEQIKGAQHIAAL